MTLATLAGVLTCTYIIPLLIGQAYSLYNIEFQQEGVILPTLGFVHLHLEFNLSSIQAACNGLKSFERKIQTIIDKDLTLDALARTPIKELSSRVRIACDAIPTFLHQHGHQRAQRGLLSVLGTIFGWFGLTQLADILTGNNNQHIRIDVNKMNRNNKQFTENINALSKNQHIIEQYIRQVDATIQHRLHMVESNVTWLKEHTMIATFDEQVQNIERITQVIMTGMISTLQHRLSPLLVSPSVITTQLKEISDQIIKVGGQLPLFLPEHIYQLPTSAVLDQKTQCLHILTHIPFLPKDAKQMNAYALLDFPFLLSYQHELVAKVDANDALIAVTPDYARYTIISQNQLRTSCISIQQTHFCPNILLMSNFEGQCLARLFKNDLRDIHQWCPILIWKQPWGIFPTATSWTAYSTAPIPYQIQCHNGTKISRTIQLPTFIHIDEGCVAISTLFLIPSPPIELQAQEVISNTITDIYFDNFTLDQLSRTLAELHNTSLTPQPIVLHHLLNVQQQLMHYTDSQDYRERDSRINTLLVATETITAILTISTIVGILFCLWKGHRIKEQMTTQPVQ